MMVQGGPRLLLRLEGLAVFVTAILVYAQTGSSWILFVALFLLPDLSMLAYLSGARAGAACYNAAHAYVLPLLLLGLGVVTARAAVATVALIVIAHIGFDRALGYGLKYATGFGDSHLGRIGRR